MADSSAGSGRLKANVVTLPGVLMQSVTAIAPAIAIALTMLAFNFLGDGLRDALDPQNTR